MNGWSYDRWGDLLTLGIMSVTFWVMLGFMVRRTWRWDGLGRSLTALTVGLGLSASIKTFFFFSPRLLPDEVGWSIRLLIIGSCLGVIATLARGLPDD